MKELPIIQKTYDLIKWYIPILNRLPKEHRFTLGDRIINNLYDLLEENSCKNILWYDNEFYFFIDRA